MPLDPVLEILTRDGKPLSRAVLRSVGLTYSTFRDHDANGSGIRIEKWNDLATNDYLYTGTQLLRIRALPKNPDDDCQFWSEGGRRRGYFNTTPHHVAQGSPMYKVEIHAPGVDLPVNGQPVFTLPWRNDDGGSSFGKDSYLLFDPPEDGEYQVRVSDAQGRYGAEYAYRLTLRAPNPGFTVDFTPKAPAVWKEGAVPVTITAKRRDGYEGPIEVQFLSLPIGLQAPRTTIPEGEENTTVAISADKDAIVSKDNPPLKLIAHARYQGKELASEMHGQKPSIVERGVIQPIVIETELLLQPGKVTRVTVMVERRNNFQGRIPLDVRGLPHGVRVLDIGLNGILVTEKETMRSFNLYCEAWVQPQDHPIVITAKHEAKNTDHAAATVMLRIVPPKKTSGQNSRGDQN